MEWDFFDEVDAILGTRPAIYQLTSPARPVSDFFVCNYKRGLPSRDISANHMARILR